MVFRHIFAGRKAAIGPGAIAVSLGFAFWCSTPPARAQQNAGGDLDVLRLRPNF